MNTTTLSIEQVQILEQLIRLQEKLSVIQTEVKKLTKEVSQFNNKVNG